MIYLDEAAISKPRQEVIDVVNDIMYNHWFNPNSVYNDGLETKRMILRAKEYIATELNCGIDDLIMCSSGSEANTTALLGIMKKHNYPHFITSTIGHASVIENPYAKKIVTVDEYGRYDLNIIKEIRDKFVSLEMANSEIGVIQDIKEIVDILHNNGCIIHSDCTAIMGKNKIDLKNLDLDLATVTAQKIGGILGAAALYIKPGIEIEPLIYGHDKNHNGTPNTLAICAFGEATRLINWDEIKILKEKRDYLIDRLLENKEITLNGSLAYRLPNNVNICIHNIELSHQQLVAMLDMFGYDISSGSACNAGNPDPSKTLLAIGLSEEDANHSIRITLSNEITYDQLDCFAKDLFGIIDQFKKNNVIA